MVVYYMIIPLLSYLIGNFSTASLIAKYFKSLNVYKVGTGHPDTENIYKNVSKPLGVLAGFVDISKMYIFLWLINRFLGVINPELDHSLLLFIYGFMMIVGHCLPIINNFKGGRGIFTFIGFLAFFAFWSIFSVSIIAVILITVFKQIRFAQYMIVLLTPFVNYFIFNSSDPSLFQMLTASVLIGAVNFIVSKRLGEI